MTSKHDLNVHIELVSWLLQGGLHSVLGCEISHAMPISDSFPVPLSGSHRGRETMLEQNGYHCDLLKNLTNEQNLDLENLPLEK